MKAQVKPIAGLTVRPVVAGDLAILRKLNSPVLHYLDGKKGKAPELTNEDIYDLCFQFTRPACEAYAIAEKGVGEFRRQAILQIGMQLGLQELNALSELVMKAFWAGLNPYIQAVVKKGEAQLALKSNPN